MRKSQYQMIIAHPGHQYYGYMYKFVRTPGKSRWTSFRLLGYSLILQATVLGSLCVLEKPSIIYFRLQLTYYSTCQRITRWQQLAGVEQCNTG